MRNSLYNNAKTPIVIVSLIIITLLLNDLSFAQIYETGDIIQDEYGIEMVYVPGGTYILGVTQERLRILCEQHEEADPEHCVEIIQQDTGATYVETVEIQPFWIDRFEVTIEQFNEFCGIDAISPVEDCVTPPRDARLTQQPQQPQVNVSWYTADAICRLRSARLPTEAEWEYAASGPNQTLFAWGNTFNLNHIELSDLEYPLTHPVGLIPDNQSWVGAFDLTGNVEEWVEDRFGTRILSNISAEDWPSPLPLNSLEIFRVTKGGFWNSPYWNLTNFYREASSPQTMSENIGFRCVRSLIAT